jgi:hypothetical protein
VREGNRTKISGTVAAAVRTRNTNSATARDWRQPQPSSRPRHGEEQPDRRGDGGKWRPQPLPERDTPRLLQGANEHGPRDMRLTAHLWNCRPQTQRSSKPHFGSLFALNARHHTGRNTLRFIFQPDYL